MKNFIYNNKFKIIASSFALSYNYIIFKFITNKKNN